MTLKTTHYSTVSELKAKPTNATHPFEAVFLFKKSTAKTARNGSEYLIVEFGDATGSFTFTCFDSAPYFSFLKEGKSGAILKAQGQTEYYQDKFNPRMTTVVELTDQEIKEDGWRSKLVESSLEDADDMWAEIQEHIQSIQNSTLRQTVQYVMDEIGECFQKSSAAMVMHHAYHNGLMEHTLHMARVAKAILPLYKEIDHDLAMAGVLLHDTGKTIEYKTELTTTKTRTGILQGHVVLGYRLVRKAAMQAKLGDGLRERLEHIVLSHQGELEWGAAVMAATPEAVFVSMIDHLDAKMGIVQYALRKANGTDEFSPYMLGIKSPMLLTPVNQEQTV